ncbi:MAG: hypothetical protein WAV11_02895 [Minisyncoccia bacterium]
MQKRVLKLGTICRDKATGLNGTLTHWIIDMGRKVGYLFQPKKLDENGQPVPCLYLVEERLEIKESDFEIVEIPFEILGTTVTAKASGFTGMAIEFIRHINGCFHVVIQPSGLCEKTGAPIERHDFDLRECTGRKIIELKEAELERSKKKSPSPSGYGFKISLPASLTKKLPFR